MERLTNADHKEMGLYAYCGEKNPYEIPLTIGELAAFPEAKYSPREILEEVFARLAAYEDTGLDPEDIKELCTDDVVKLAKLFRRMIENGTIDHLQDLMDAENAGRLVVLPCKIGDNVWVRWEDMGPCMASVQGISMSASCDDTLLRFGGYPPISVWGSDRGKTWFLTREEADAAEEALREEDET